MKSEQNPNQVSERSKEYGYKLWELVKTHFSNQISDRPTAPNEAIPPRVTTKYPILKRLLLFFPVILVIGFLVSFFWDFNGVSLNVFGGTLYFDGILRMVSISGLIGFLTNWLAITMLFRPTFKRPLLGQGLIPAQKDRIAYRLAKAVSEDLINPDIIKQKIIESKAISKYRETATLYIKNVIDDPVFRTELKALAISYVEEMIAQPEVRENLAKTIIGQVKNVVQENSFEKIALKAYSFLKGQEMQVMVEEALEKLPGGVEKGLDKLDDLLDKLPEKIEQNSSTIEDLVTSVLYKLVYQLDVHALVEDNLRTYDERKLENLIKNASNDQLQYIQYLGAILGTFGGLVIWNPLISLSLIFIILAIIIGIDSLLLKLNKKISN